MIAGISAQAKANYRTRLNASMECVRLLLMQALPFRGHDESEDSKNQEALPLVLISQGTLETGRGMNQEVTLKRPGEIRWSSHYNTIISVISLFSSTLEVLEEMKKIAIICNSQR
ncbi:hypothetical protein ACET3Z_018079 [Daucus carota]